MRDLTGCTIAFDLDGTLVETAPDIHRALAGVMTEERLRAPTLAETRMFVGQGARALMVRAFAIHGVVHDDARLDELVARFIAIYSSDIAAHSTVFPGCVETLTSLANSGATLCVCTNKLTGLSNQLLAALDMSHHFAAVVGADAVQRRKPHPDHFLAAIKAAKGDVTRSLMIGDSAADVGTAKAAAAPVALVSFGYTDTAPDLLGADAVFRHYSELPALAARLLGR